MSEMIYCYCCRTHHPSKEMRRFRTRAGERWRCVRSIEAANSSRQVRDDFGQEQTRQNREATRRQADWVLLLRALGISQLH